MAAVAAGAIENTEGCAASERCDDNVTSSTSNLLPAPNDIADVIDTSDDGGCLQLSATMTSSLPSPLSPSSSSSSCASPSLQSPLNDVFVTSYPPPYQWMTETKKGRPRYQDARGLIY